MPAECNHASHEGGYDAQNKHFTIAARVAYFDTPHFDISAYFDGNRFVVTARKARKASHQSPMSFFWTKPWRNTGPKFRPAPYPGGDHFLFRRTFLALD
jgi:hypothetical protein